MDINDPAYQAGLISSIEDTQPESVPTEETSKLSNDLIVDGEIASMILSRKQASKVWRQEKKDKMDLCWNHYKQVYDRTNKEPWQSTTFIPASPKVAEVIASNMHSALMSPSRPVEYQACRPEFEHIVNDVNELISVDFEKCKFKVHWTDFLRNLCITGTAIGKIEYMKEWANVNVKERFRELPGMSLARRLLGLAEAPQETITTKRMLVKDYASFKHVDLYDIYPEPGSLDISKDRWIIEEGKISNAKLIELSNEKDETLRIVNVSQELLLSNPRDLNNNPEKQERDLANDEMTKPTSYLEPDQEHVLDEYWGPAPIWMIQPELYGDESRKYEMVNAWFWLIDGVHVVRKQLTPWRDAEPPYVKGVYIRVPGQFYGIGPLELMLGLQIELNESRNCRQDEINLKLNKPLAILKSMVAQGEWGRLVQGPGALWLFDNIDDIRKALMPIEFDANLGDSWRGSAEIYNEIQEVTAAVKATIGTGGGADQAGGDTFRGQLLNRQVASERFIMYARILEITGLTDAIKKFYQRIYQFKGWKEAEQIIGPKRASQFKFISPEELELIAHLVPNGVTSMENKGVQLAQMAEEFRMFSQFPWYKQVEAARRMVIQRGQADPDSVIFSDDELKMFNQEKQRLIEEAGTPPGMGPQVPNEGMQPGPIAGDVPGPNDGMPEPAMPARGPGGSDIDVTGRPIS